MSRFACPALAAGLLFHSVLAGAALVGGQILDEGGKPLEGARVQLLDHGPGTLSDAQGRFQLRAPDGVAVWLRISRMGYATRSLKADTALLEIRLESSLLEGVPVTVSAGRVGLASGVTHSNLGKEELRLAHQGQDLSLLLEGTPSLITTSYSGTSMGYNEIRLRGFDQKRVEVLVNGVPLNDPEDHYVYWVDLPDMGSSLKDVQVQRGAGTGIYGGSNFGGSVNLLTEGEEEAGVRLESGAGSFNTRRHSLAWSSGLLEKGWQLDARWSQLATEGFRQATAVDMWGAYFSARRVLPHGSLRLTHYTGHELTHTAWEGVTLAQLRGLDGQPRNRRQNNDAAYANSIDDFQQPHSEACLEWILPDASELEATLYHVDGSGFYETLKTARDPLAYGLPLPADGGTVDLVNRRFIDKRHSGFTAFHRRHFGFGRLTLGLHGYTYDAQHHGRVLWASPLPAGEAPAGRYYTHAAAKERGGLHASLEHALAPTWVATVSLAAQASRYALRQERGLAFPDSLLNRFEDRHFFVNPSLALVWTPQDGLSFSGSAALSRREPSRSEYWDAWQGPDDRGARPMFAQWRRLPDGGLEWSNPLVKHERMLDLEVGAAWRGRQHQLGANLYWLDMRDEIVAFGGMDEESPVRGNAPRSHHAGLELEGRARVLASLEVGGNASFSRSVIDELTLHELRYNADWSTRVVDRDMSGNPAALSPDLVANLWLDWRPLAGVVLRPRLQHVGAQLLDTGGEEAWSVLDPALIEANWLTSQGEVRHRHSLDAWTSLGLDARWSLNLGEVDVELSLKGENLLDRDYESSGYWNDWVDADGDGLYEPQPVLYPAAGRNWMVGLRLAL